MDIHMIAIYDSLEPCLVLHCSLCKEPEIVKTKNAPKKLAACMVHSTGMRVATNGSHVGLCCHACIAENEDINPC